MNIALKRNIDPDMVQQRINNIVRAGSGDGETNTQEIARLVMEELSQIDQLAYPLCLCLSKLSRSSGFEDFVKDELD